MNLGHLIECIQLKPKLMFWLLFSNTIYCSVNTKILNDKMIYFKTLNHEVCHKEISSIEDPFSYNTTVFPNFFLQHNLNSYYIDLKIQIISNNSQNNFYNDLFLYEYYYLKGAYKFSDYYHSRIINQNIKDSFKFINFLIVEMKLNDFKNDEIKLRNWLQQYYTHIKKLEENSLKYKYAEFCFYYFNILYNLNTDFEFKHQAEFNEYKLIKKIKEYNATKDFELIYNENIFICNLLKTNKHLYNIKESQKLINYILRRDQFFKSNNIFFKNNILKTNTFLLNQYQLILKDKTVNSIYKNNLKTIDSIDGEEQNLVEFVSKIEQKRKVDYSFYLNIVILVILSAAFFLLNKKIKFNKEHFSTHEKKVLIKENHTTPIPQEKKIKIEKTNSEIPTNQNLTLSKEIYKEIDDNFNKWLEEKNYLSKLNIHDLSIKLDTNVVYLNNYINVKYNTTLKNYINFLRIEESKNIIKNDVNRIYSIEGISNMVGYNSVNSFKSNFLKFTNTNLTDYLKNRKHED
jgi:AraC-like DNA-binding protein